MDMIHREGSKVVTQIVHDLWSTSVKIVIILLLISFVSTWNHSCKSKWIWWVSYVGVVCVDNMFFLPIPIYKRKSYSTIIFIGDKTRYQVFNEQYVSMGNRSARRPQPPPARLPPSVYPAGPPCYTTTTNLPRGHRQMYPTYAPSNSRQYPMNLIIEPY
jgi:hypothetical protein